MLTQAPEVSGACVWGKSISQRAAEGRWRQDHTRGSQLTDGPGNESSMGWSEWRSSRPTSLE